MQITVSTSTDRVLWSTVLGDDDQTLGRALAGRKLQSVAGAVMSHNKLQEMIVLRLLDIIDKECGEICKRTSPSLFRKMETSSLQSLQWTQLIDDLKAKAPTLVRVRLILSMP